MAHIEKRIYEGKRGKTTKYRVKLMFDGETFNKTFNSYADAKEWATKTEADLYRGHLTTKTKTDPTLSETIDRYITYILPTKAKGSENKQRQILNWWRDTIGELHLSAMTPTLLERYKEKLSDRLAKRHRKHLFRQSFTCFYYSQFRRLGIYE